jgi:hypothetical protein
MGRPKKRQRTEEEENEMHDNPAEESQISWDTSTDPYDILTPGGNNLQPWILDSVPDLTPDTSTTNSPPLLNLPPELQNTNSHHPYQPSYNTDLSTSILLDPGLNNTGLNTSPLPSCACLSELYLALSNLQNLTPGPENPFPFSLHPLRNSMTTAARVISCQSCPQKFLTAMQNTQLIGTLLITIADRFAKILENITSEAMRAQEADEQKKFRLADLNTSTGHLHTNGIGCAAAFSVNLEAGEWRSLAKKVVRAEVYGPNGGGGEPGHEDCPFFLGLVEKMEKRQEGWHEMP